MIQVEIKKISNRPAWRMVVRCDYCKQPITGDDGWFVWENPHNLTEQSYFSPASYLHEACLNDFVFWAHTNKPGVDWDGCLIKDLHKEDKPVYSFDPKQCTPPKLPIADLRMTDADQWLSSFVHHTRQS